MLTCPFRSTLLALTIAVGSAQAIAQGSTPTVAVQREVCAAAFQKLLNKPYIFVRSATVDGHEAHQFRSPNSVYANSCYLNGTTVVWRTDKSPSHTAPGRWRTHALDEQVTWSHDGKSVTIDMRYSDGSGEPTTYSVQALRKSAGLPR